MSILVWLRSDGGVHHGYPLPHRLADLICARRPKWCNPEGYRLAYRLRITLKDQSS